LCKHLADLGPPVAHRLVGQDLLNARG
jgi:hypothetical protein